MGDTPGNVSARAVVLAGGRSSRLGGTPKALFRTNDRAHGREAEHGSTLVEHLVGDLLELGLGTQAVVVVGPEDLPRMPTLRTREDPPFSGPAAGIVAGLNALDKTQPTPAWTLLLACDMPAVRPAVVALLEAAATCAPEDRGIVVIDDGRLQPLAGIYRTGALREVVRDQPSVNRSVRSLVGTLWDRELALSGVTDDVDTWDDVDRFGLLPPRD
ncbi:NTP transferase domain-containing protein [Kocuria sp. JC486]|uniref:NTP transferase domain-containing protein n=1 Tax=Kocuria sp. JC486 TaxID=1970736 RepID=UPI00141DCC6D|nr:NTP transferase domain-containing protein [Kocuria sp. JC486]